MRVRTGLINDAAPAAQPKEEVEMGEGIPVIVCSGANGRIVVYGRCDHMPQVGESVTLTGARMIMWWERVGLFGVAANGPSSGSRLTGTVPSTSPGPCTQVLAVTEDAARAIESWPAHE